MLIVMEYVRGVTLKQAKSQYYFDELAVWQIAREILIALRHLWQIHSIIHRDIKPENIMLDENFCVKLLDFGLSKPCLQDAETAITIGNISLGTPGYMGPELFKDSLQADFRADIFSVGATLFFLLTGSAPFKGNNLQQFYDDTLRNSPPAPEMFGGVCSPRGIAVIRKMMAREPQDRYRSYDELFADVNALLNELE
jgi:serine/threonine protein kinase